MAQSRREFLKTLGVGGAGLVLASPILNLLTPEQASADSLKFNPFHQPINTNEYYGSGLGVTPTSIRNIAEIAEEPSPSEDVMNIDGSYEPDILVNGKPTNKPTIQELDAIMLEEWENGTRDYLPGHWNSLQTMEERKDWVLKCNAVDDTHTIPYETDKWVSGQYARRKRLGFYGFKDSQEQKFSEITLEDYKYPILGRFNIPCTEVSSFKLDENGEFIYENGSSFPQSHGLGIGVLVGDDSLNYWDWLKIEAQANPGTNIEQAPIGSQSIPLGPGGAYVAIRFKYMYPASNGELLSVGGGVGWNIDNEGNVGSAEGNTDKIMTGQRPIVTAIEQDNVRPERASISNYPNPFNPNTTIRYDVVTNGEYSLIVYDGLGQVVKVLEDDKSLNDGSYEVSWDGTNLEGQKVGSGVYFSRLIGRTMDGDLETKVGKMTLVK